MLTCITSWSHKTIWAGAEISGQACASILAGWFTMCCRYRIMLFKKSPLKRCMVWLCFRKREVLITDSEQRTGNKIMRRMQCLLTRISHKNNLIPRVQRGPTVILKKRNLRQFPDRTSHFLGVFSLEASTFTGQLLYLL